MCDPFTAMAIGSTALKAGGSIISGMQSGAAGDLQAQMFAANAAALRMQAQVAEKQVGLAYQRGALKETELRDAGDDVLGKQTLFYAANNLDPSYGSPLVHEATTVQRVERDAALVRANSAIDAADAKSRAANLSTAATSQQIQSSVASMRADQARFAGYMGAGNALLRFGTGGANSAMDFGGNSASFDT